MPSELAFALSADEVARAEREVATDAGKIRANALLHAIYEDVYGRILAEVPRAAYPRALELGSGGGFLKERAPWVTTSECVPLPGIERVVDAGRIEDAYAPEALDAILLFNVFHHLPDVAAFLRGAEVVLRPGGRIVLVEPWFTPVGQWFHRLLHHEPASNDPDDWGLRGVGRMAGANARLPTSVFRDGTRRLAREAPRLRVVKRAPFHKWLYLVSGGLRLNTRVPRALADRLVRLDARPSLLDGWLGLFALVVVEKETFVP